MWAKTVIYIEIVILLAGGLVYGLFRLGNYMESLPPRQPNVVFEWNNHSYIKWTGHCIEHNPDCQCIINKDYRKEHNPG